MQGGREVGRQGGRDARRQGNRDAGMKGVGRHKDAVYTAVHLVSAANTIACHQSTVCCKLPAGLSSPDATLVSTLLTHVNLSASEYTYSTDLHSLLSLSLGVV